MSDPKDLPAHLRPLFNQPLSKRAAKGIEKAMNSKVERLSTGRLGRAFKLSKLAVKGGSHALLDKAQQVLSKEGNDSRGIELATEMLSTFSELRGVTMKLGQMFSYLDDALPPEARKVLAVLQRDVSPMPWEIVREQIVKEFDKTPEELFVQIDETPIAAASIGQVHRATLNDGTEVAVKIQYPGIDQAMASDLKNARILSLFQRMLLFNTDTKSIMAELEERFLDECDYRKEAAYQNAYRRRLASHPHIIVPEVHAEYSGKTVLTTTFYEGRSFYQWLEDDPSEAERAKVARLFYRFYIGSFYLDGLFNCDPHPGNYLFGDDGRVIFLDYGCSRLYPKDRMDLWIRLCRAVFEDNQAELDTMAVELDFIEDVNKFDREAFRDLMRYLYLPYLKDEAFDFAHHRPEDTFRRMFVDNPNLFKLNMPAEAVFLNRIGFGLVSLLTEIGASLNCRRQASEYFEGRDPDWPEDPHFGKRYQTTLEIV